MADIDVTPNTFAIALLVKLGLPITQDWQTIINQWVASEGGFDAALAERTHNPLNARCEYSEHQYSPWGLDGPNASCTTTGFVVWPTLGDAVEAYGKQLHQHAYIAIPHAKTSTALKQAIITSPWAAGNYGNGKNWAGNGSTVSGSNSTSSSNDTIISNMFPGGGPVDVNQLVQDITSGNFFGAALESFGLGKGLSTETGFSWQGIFITLLGLLIGVVLVIKGFGTLTNVSAANIGQLASSVAGLSAARAATVTPEGMEPAEITRTGRLPGGHVSYIYRRRKVRGLEATETPSVPVETAIRPSAPATPSASPETPRIVVSPGQPLAVIRRGARQQEATELTREQMRSAFSTKLQALNATATARTRTRRQAEKDVTRRIIRNARKLRQETFEHPTVNRVRRLE